MYNLKWFCINTIKKVTSSTGCLLNLPEDDHIPLLTTPLNVICDQPVKLQEPGEGCVSSSIVCAPLCAWRQTLCREIRYPPLDCCECPGPVLTCWFDFSQLNGCTATISGSHEVSFYHYRGLSANLFSASLWCRLPAPCCGAVPSF